jgi:hypothetical protein
MSLLLSATNKQNTVSTAKEKDVRMSIEAAFPLTPTISFISYGKIMFNLRVFDLRPNFQERDYRVNRDVAV